MKASDIITLVAVLVAGTATWFSYKGWEDYAGKPFDEAARRPQLFPYRSASEQSRSPLVPTRLNRVARQRDETTTRDTVQAELGELEKTLAGLRKTNDELSEEIQSATTERLTLQESIRKKRETIQTNTKRIQELQEWLAATGEPEELKRRVEQNITVLNQANEALIRERNRLEETIRLKESREDTLSNMREVARMQASGEMRANFSTTIRDTYGRWGFVTINAGASQGVNARAALDVLRGGQVVARLQVTTVEPGVAVCAIVPGTMPDGEMLRPGDRVVTSVNPAPVD